MGAHIAKGFLAGLERRDGYRNFAVNMCHLLPEVRCCADCDKNRAPKHGGVEFRLFDVAYGVRLRQLVGFVEALVRQMCLVQHSAAEQTALRPLLRLQGDSEAEALLPLLERLGMNASVFLETFAIPIPTQAENGRKVKIR